MAERSVTPRHVGAMHVHFDDGTTWPLIGEAMSNLSWRLRYGHVTKSDLVTAAEVLDAYHNLIAVGQRRRNAVVEGIRAAHDQGAVASIAASMERRS